LSIRDRKTGAEGTADAIARWQQEVMGAGYDQAIGRFRV